MGTPIASTNPSFFDQNKKPQWYTMSGETGMKTAPWRLGQGLEWGRLGTIEYLIELANEWIFALRADWAPILLGDIAPEGGAQSKLGKLMIQKKWHKSHNSGTDFDIYVIRKDGQPLQSSIDDKTTYDEFRTTELAKTIYKVGAGQIERVFFDDQAVINTLRLQGITTIGPDPGRRDASGQLIQPPTPHRDHFHIRLKGGTY